VHIGESGHRLRKVLVAATPIVDHLRSADAEPPSDLAGINEVVNVDLASHSLNRSGDASSGA
jgi:hypothetical protein